MHQRRKIGSRVGQNQTTVMRICDRWMQEGTTDRSGRSHPPQCTTSREDRTEGTQNEPSLRYNSGTSLVRIAGTLNIQRYISEVLAPVVLSYLQGLATAIFQQNDARPHVARIVQKFFVNHQIKLPPWPARSPDLSPIEFM
ncbi:hypothetical protein TNCV_3216731 [Trichonephila clavipes]|nr:hypothetical protein TNCV_3216731 [Trichonephila clavipes]